jgi:GTPase-activating protein
MSDLASPLLVTMGDEAHAYICFCALMKRLHSNFMLDGIVMTLKFQHLAEGLLYYDPDFYAYLKSHQVSNTIYRMLHLCGNYHCHFQLLLCCVCGQSAEWAMLD